MRKGTTGNFAKNMIKSTGYIMSETLQGVNPTLTRYAKESVEGAKNMYMTARTFRKTCRQQIRELTQSKAFKQVKEVGANALDDIKTGKLYNPERKAAQQAKMMSDMGLDDLVNFDFDDDDDVTTSTNSDSSGTATAGSVKSVGVAVANAQFAAASASADQIVGANVQIAKANSAQSKKQFSNLNNSIAVVNTSIMNLHSDLVSPLNAHIMNSATFYQTVGQQLAEQTKMISEVRDMMASKMGNSTAGNGFGKRLGSKPTSAWEAIMGGGAPDLKAFKQFAKTSFMNNTEVGQILSMLPDMEMISQLIASGELGSPVSLLLTEVGKSAIQRSKYGKSLERTEKLIGNSFGHLAGRIAAYGKRNTRYATNAFGENKLQGGWLARIAKFLDFTPKAQNKLEAKAPSKDPASWTGQDSAALKVVIPTQLAGILAALTGKEPKVFNYNTGKWESVSGIAANFTQGVKKATTDATYGYRNDLLDEAVRNANEAAGQNKFTKGSKAMIDLGKAYDILMSLMAQTNENPAEYTSKEEFKRMAKRHGWVGTFIPEKTFDLLASTIYSRSSVATGFTSATFNARVASNKFKQNQTEEGAIAYTINGSGLANKANYDKNGILGTRDSHGNDVFYYLRDYYYQLHKISDIVESGRPAAIAKLDHKEGRGKSFTRASSYAVKSHHVAETRGAANKSAVSKYLIQKSKYAAEVDLNSEDATYVKNVYGEFVAPSGNATTRGDAFKRDKELETANLTFIDKFNDRLSRLIYGDNPDGKSLMDALKDIKGTVAQVADRLKDQAKTWLKSKYEQFKSSDSGKRFFGTLKDIGNGVAKVPGMAWDAVNDAYVYSKNTIKGWRGQGSGIYNFVGGKSQSKKAKKIEDALKSLNETMQEILASEEVEDEAEETKEKPKSTFEKVKDAFDNSAIGADINTWAKNSLAPAVESAKASIAKTFGSIEQQGKEKAGKSTLLAEIKKFLPEMGAGGAVGGLALAAMTGSGLGLLGGVALGAGAMLFKKSDTVSNFVLGKLDSIKVGKNKDKSLKSVLEQKFPSLAKSGALGGALGLMGVVPGGLLGGLAIGAGVNLLSGTETFKDVLFGKPDEKGERNGGLVGSVKLHVVNPLINFVKTEVAGAKEFLKKNIFDPLKSAFHSFTDHIKNKFKKVIEDKVLSVTDAIGRSISQKFNSIFGTIMKPVRKLLGGAFNLGKKIISAPFKALETIGNGIANRDIRKGYSSKSAKERVAYEQGRGKLSKAFFKNKMAAYDEWAANASYEDIKEFRRLSDRSMLDKDNKDIRQSMYDKVTANFDDSFGTFGQQRELKKLINSDKFRSGEGFDDLKSMVTGWKDSGQMSKEKYDLLFGSTDAEGNFTEGSLSKLYDQMKDNNQKKDNFKQAQANFIKKHGNKFTADDMRVARFASRLDAERLEGQMSAEEKKKAEIELKKRELELENPIQTNIDKNVSNVTKTITGIHRLLEVIAGVSNKEPLTVTDGTNNNVTGVNIKAAITADQDSTAIEGKAGKPIVTDDGEVLNTVIRNGKEEIDVSDSGTAKALAKKQEAQEAKVGFFKSFSGGLINKMKDLLGVGKKEEKKETLWDKIKKIGSGILTGITPILGTIIGSPLGQLALAVGGVSLFLKTDLGETVKGWIDSAIQKLKDKKEQTEDDAHNADSETSDYNERNRGAAYDEDGGYSRKLATQLGYEDRKSKGGLWNGLVIGKDTLDTIENKHNGRKMTTYDADDYIDDNTSDRVIRRFGVNAAGAIGGVKSLQNATNFIFNHGGLLGKTASTLLNPFGVVKNGAGKAADALAENADDIVNVANSVGKVGGKIGNGIANAVTKVGSKAVTYVSDASKAVNSVWGATGVQKVVGNTANVVKSAATSIASSKAATAVSGVASSIKTGVETVLQWVATKLGVPITGSASDDLVGGILEAMKGKMSAAGAALKATGRVLYAANIANAVTYALQSAGAKEILGILETPTFGQRVLAAVCNGLNYAIPIIGGIIPTDKLVTLVYNALSTCGIDFGNFAQQRENAKEVLAAFNEENGKNYNLKEFLYNEKGEATLQTKLAHTVGDTWSKVKTGASNAWSNIKTGVGEAMTQNKQVLSATWNNVKTGVSNAATKVKDVATGAWNTVKEKATGVWNTVKGAATTVSTGVKNVFNVAKSKVTEGVDYAKEAVSGITAMRQKIEQLYFAVDTDRTLADVISVKPEVSEDNPLGGITNAVGTMLKFSIIPSLFFKGVGQKIKKNIIDPAIDKIKDNWATNNAREAEVAKMAMTGNVQGIIDYTGPEMDDDVNPIGWAQKVGLFFDKIFFVPVAGVSYLGHKIVDGVKALIGRMKDTRAANDKIHSDISTLALNGDLSGLSIYTPQGAEDGSNPYSWMNTAESAIAKTIAYPLAGVISLGKKVKTGIIDPIVGWVKTSASTVGTVVDDMKPLAVAGDITGLAMYEVQSDDGNPVGWVAKAGALIGKLVLGPVAVVKSIGNKISDFFGTVKEGLAAVGASTATSFSTAQTYKDSGDLSGLMAMETTSDEGGLLGFLPKITDFTAKFAYAVPTLANSIGTTIKNIFSQAKDSFPDIGALVSDLWGTYTHNDSDMSSYESTISKHLPEQGGFFGALGAGVAYMVGNVIKPFIRIVRAGNIVGDKVGEVAGNVKDTAVEVKDKVVNTASNALAWVKDKANNVGTAVMNWSGSGSHATQKGNQRRFGASTIDENGCGPAVAATVLRQYGRRGNVNDAASYAESNGFVAGASNMGTRATFFGDYLGRQGIGTSYTTSKSGINSAIGSGRPTILLGQNSSNTSKANSPFGPNPHYVVARGAGNNVLVDDPELDRPALYSRDILDSTKLGIMTGGASALAKTKGGYVMQTVGTDGEVQESNIKAKSKTGFITQTVGTDGDNSNYNAKKKVAMDDGKRYIKNSNGENQEVKTADGAVWNFLKAAGMTDAGAAGLMGNLYAESAIKYNILEGLAKKRLKENGVGDFDNKSYTAAIDSGAISKESFLHPLPNKQYGYGLAQWTSPGRKQKLYDLVKGKNASIADPKLQLEYLIAELTGDYSGVMRTLTTTNNLKSASDIVLTKFESPNGAEGMKGKRQAYGQTYLDLFAKNKPTITINDIDGTAGSYGVSSISPVGNTASTSLGATDSAATATQDTSLAGRLSSAFSNFFSTVASKVGGVAGKIVNLIFGGLGNSGGQASSGGVNGGTGGEFGAVSTAGNSSQETSIVNKMNSILGTCTYSMSGPRNPEKGSADCSSTVQWVLKKAIGVDPGGDTSSILTKNTGVVVDKYSSGDPLKKTSSGPNLANLRPGDLLLYSRPDSSYSEGRQYRVGHVEMYMGNGQRAGHGSGTGPKVTAADTDASRYIMAKRYTTEAPTGTGSGLEMYNFTRMKSNYGKHSGGAANVINPPESINADTAKKLNEMLVYLKQIASNTGYNTAIPTIIEVVTKYGDILAQINGSKAVADPAKQQDQQNQIDNEITAMMTKLEAMAKTL